jgi:NAD+ synthase (glutamine-hydrolysing)
MEEIAYGPAAWLWDYLRRSGASGFLLPLSGGADSSSTAAIVGCMCQTVYKEIQEGNNQVLVDALRCAMLSLLSNFSAYQASNSRASIV